VLRARSVTQVRALLDAGQGDDVYIITTKVIDQNLQKAQN
jgi:hypothetical protein